MADLPDVTDPDIRAMVLRDHQPVEWWSHDDYSEPPKFRRVLCERCRQDWPCLSREAALEAEEQAAQEPLPPLFPSGESQWESEPPRRKRWWSLL